MITKETARQIYNCYTQIEEIDRLKNDMADEVTKAREKEKEYKKLILKADFLLPDGIALQIFYYCAVLF